jgi:hypothetical protein
MAQEAMTAQAGWLLYGTGQTEGLTDILATLPGQDVSSLNEPVWSLGAALIHAEQENPSEAIRVLRQVGMSSGEFAGLPRGPARIGILAMAAMLLGHPALGRALPSDQASRWGTSVAILLDTHVDAHVLVGWPAIMLGSKHRYIGLAHLAARQPAKAAVSLARAADENSGFAALHVRTLFDSSRALIRMPATYSEGIAEMRRVEQVSRDLGMTRLAGQAAAEMER